MVPVPQRRFDLRLIESDDSGDMELGTSSARPDFCDQIFEPLGWQVKRQMEIVFTRPDIAAVFGEKEYRPSIIVFVGHASDRYDHVPKALLVARIIAVWRRSSRITNVRSDDPVAFNLAEAGDSVGGPVRSRSYLSEPKLVVFFEALFGPLAPAVPRKVRKNILSEVLLVPADSSDQVVIVEDNPQGVPVLKVMELLAVRDTEGNRIRSCKL